MDHWGCQEDNISQRVGYWGYQEDNISHRVGYWGCKEDNISHTEWIMRVVRRRYYWLWAFPVAMTQYDPQLTWVRYNVEPTIDYSSWDKIICFTNDQCNYQEKVWPILQICQAVRRIYEGMTHTVDQLGCQENIWRYDPHCRSVSAMRIYEGMTYTSDQLGCQENIWRYDPVRLPGEYMA